MERHCPDAWLLNYSNPLTTLTRAVTKETSIKTIGFCHEWLGVRYKLAQLLAVEESDFQPRIAGINHLIWLLDLKAAGQDLMPALSDLAGQILTGDGRLFGDDDMTSMVDRGKVKARLLQVYGAMPVAGDRHVAEFFPGFLTEATAQGQTYGLERTSVEERYQWREWDKRRLCDLLHDKLDIAPFLEKPSGEAAHSLISALATHARYTGIMNLPNQGQIANLPPDVVVETYAVVDSSGISGLSMGPLPPGIQAVVSRHVANQEMIVEAALTGDIHLARQALLNDPLVTVEPDGAERMLDEMLLANQAYLPQFFG
jgi:alpha-galactosidase